MNKAVIVFMVMHMFLTAWLFAKQVKQMDILKTTSVTVYYMGGEFLKFREALKAIQRGKQNESVSSN